MPSNKLVASNLIVYSIGHALVDATTVAVVFAAGLLNNLLIEEIVLLILVYNVLAFGLQALIGFGVDYFKVPALAATIGSILSGLSVFSIGFPLFAVILAGIGNAFYHVGGGVISLNLDPGKAALPGIFVSTGAIGVLVGTLVGKNFVQSIFWFAPLLLLLAAAIFFTKAPAIGLQKQAKSSYKKFELIVLLLLLAVVGRAFVGTMLQFPWKADFGLLIALTCAVVLGKALGGILGDKFGWIKISVTGLLLAAPLLFLGPEIALLGIIGAFLFNFTMPITLTALANTMPQHKGFAFGLTTIALLIGALPSFSFIKNLTTPAIIFIATLVSAFLIFKALKMYSTDFASAKT